MNFDVLEYKNINEKLYVYKHKSGLKVYFVPKEGYSKKYATYSTYFGSINNSFKKGANSPLTTVPDGVAHFLEHKLFEQKDGSVMDKFSLLGANPNAYTGFSRTVYLFSCIEKFYNNFDLLVDFVQNPYITQESVDKEKGIISQEIRMYEDDPNWRVYFNTLEGLYVKNPVKIDIAGTDETIGKIDRDILYDCYNTFYNPENMIILVVGDLNVEDVINNVENKVKCFDNIPKIERIFPDEPKNINKNYIEQNLEVSMPLFNLAFKESDFPRMGIESAKYEVAIEILLNMLVGASSRLYNEVYEKGIINGAFGYEYSVEEHFAFSLIGGESSNPELIRDMIKQEILKFKDGGISKNDFERIKRSYFGKLTKSLNSIERISNLFISVYFRDIIVFDYYGLYDKITYEFVKEVLNTHFNIDNMVLSVVKPS